MSDAPQVSKDEQNWAMACHLSALAGFLIPFGNIAGPLTRSPCAFRWCSS